MATIAHILNTERGTRLFRLLALVIVTVILLFYEYAGLLEDEGLIEDVELGPASALVFSFIIYTIVLGLVMPKLPSEAGPWRLWVFVFAMSAVDIALVLALVHYTGGVENFTLILIPLFILYHATYLGYASGMFSASLSAILYVALAFYEDEASGNGTVLMGQVALFYMLAGFGGFMANRMMMQERESEENVLLGELMVATAQAHGLETDTPVFGDKLCSLSGEGADEAAVLRYADALRQIHRVASVYLTRIGEAEQGKNIGKTIAFSVRARLR